jgi:hypothetical protein
VKWPEIRAGLIALAVGAGMLEGCPIPSPADTLPWQRFYAEPLRVAQAPLAWIRPTLRISERFTMFQVTGGDLLRFEVDGQDADGWHVLYREIDPEHDAYASLLEYERIGMHFSAGEQPPSTYHAFGAWLAHQIFADRPALVAVRLRFERVHVEPGEMHGTGVYAYPFVAVRR